MQAMQKLLSDLWSECFSMYLMCIIQIRGQLRVLLLMQMELPFLPQLRILPQLFQRVLPHLVRQLLHLSLPLLVLHLLQLLNLHLQERVLQQWHKLFLLPL